MTILVTGAAGNLGNVIVKQLAAQGRPVRAMVRDDEKAKKRLGEVASQIEIVKGDVRDRDGIKPLFDGVTAVIHLVAIAIEKGRATYEDVNIQGTINAVDAAVEAGVPRFINMSQNGANSLSPYRFLKSKGLAQDYVASHAPAWTALRPSTIFGPQDEFFNSIARLVKVTPLVFPLIGGGTALFQPVSAYDVADATIRCLDDPTTTSRELELGGPEVLNLGEIERRILKALDARRLLVPAPIPLLRVPVWIMERVLPGSPVTSSLLDLLAAPNVVQDNALVSHFGITPKPFSGEHIAYLRDNTIRDTFSKLFRNATVN